MTAACDPIARRGHICLTHIPAQAVAVLILVKEIDRLARAFALAGSEALLRR